MKTSSERDLVEQVEELLARYPREGVSFPKPSQSRTRDVLNDYTCGCQIRRDGAGAHLIHACATHNAAPELLRRLVEENKRVSNAFLIAFDLAGINAHPLPEALPESAYVDGYMDKVRELRAVFALIAARVKKENPDA